MEYVYHNTLSIIKDVIVLTEIEKTNSRNKQKKKRIENVLTKKQTVEITFYVNHFKPCKSFDSSIRSSPVLGANANFRTHRRAKKCDEAHSSTTIAHTPWLSLEAEKLLGLL